MKRYSMRIHLVHSIFCLAAWLAGPASAAPQRAVWRYPDFHDRASIAVSTRSYSCALVRIPMPSLTTENDALRACDPNGTNTAYRELFRDSAGITYLLATPQPGTYHLYFNCTGSLQAATAPDPDLNDPEPVRVEAYRLRGRSGVTTWSKMEFLLAQAGKPIQASSTEQFQDIDLGAIADRDLVRDMEKDRLARTPDDWAERVKDWQRKRAAKTNEWKNITCGVVLSSMLLCPQSRVCRFAVSASDCAYARIDNQPAAAWAGEYPDNEWHIGEPLFLNAGLHKVELFTTSGARVPAKLGWLTDDSTNVTTLPKGMLVSPPDNTTVQMQAIDQSLTADFQAKVTRPISFRGNPTLFYPVELADTSENRAGTNRLWTWEFTEYPDSLNPDPIPAWTYGRPRPGTAILHGDKVTHLITSAGIHKAILTVKDSLGFEGRIEKPVPCRAGPPLEYALDTTIENCPALCFEDDPLTPELWIRGSLPPVGAATVRVLRQPRIGPPADSTTVFTNGAWPVRIPLGSFAANSVTGIEWTLRYAGETIHSGTLRFELAPFRTRPTTARGGLLMDTNGAVLTLVTPRFRESARYLPQPRASHIQHITWLDDLLIVPEQPRLKDDERPVNLPQTLETRLDAAIQTVPLRLRDVSESAVGTLARLVRLPDQVNSRTDLIILSLGFDALVDDPDPARFERYLAATIDLLLSTSRKPILLITPPPFGRYRTQLRPLAVAVLRVAAARQLPVADLYTAFLCRLDPQQPLFNNPTALNAQGRELAASVIAQTLSNLETSQ